MQIDSKYLLKSVLSLVLHSSEVNGPILSQLFQVGGNHEIWHKDAFKGGEFKLIKSQMKSGASTILGGFFCFFCPYVWL